MDEWTCGRMGGRMGGWVASWTQGRVGERVDGRWWGDGCGELICADPQAARSAQELTASPCRQIPCPPTHVAVRSHNPPQSARPPARWHAGDALLDSQAPILRRPSFSGRFIPQSPAALLFAV